MSLLKGKIAFFSLTTFAVCTILQLEPGKGCSDDGGAPHIGSSAQKTDDVEMDDIAAGREYPKTLVNIPLEYCHQFTDPESCNGQTKAFGAFKYTCGWWATHEPEPICTVVRTENYYGK